MLLPSWNRKGCARWYDMYYVANCFTRERSLVLVDEERGLYEERELIILLHWDCTYCIGSRKRLDNNLICVHRRNSAEKHHEHSALPLS